MAVLLHKWEFKNIEVEFLKVSEKIWSPGLPDIGARKSWDFLILTVSASTVNLSKLNPFKKKSSILASMAIRCTFYWWSGGCGFPLDLATFFSGDWSWNVFYIHSFPSAVSRRTAVSFWQKNMYKYWLPTQRTKLVQEKYG